MVGHPPRGLPLANNLKVCFPKLYIRPQGCNPLPQNFRVLSDPLSSRAASRTSLSPHWSRRSRRAQGRGRAHAPVEPEAAAALGRCAGPGREPPRARRGHARDPPWASRLCHPLRPPHSRGRVAGSDRQAGSEPRSAGVARGYGSSCPAPYRAAG